MIALKNIKTDNKRIIIISHSLELGGVERSLIGLLWALRKPEYQVDLFLLRHEGEMMNMIPPHVNLLPEIPAYAVLARPIRKVLREGHVLLACARLWGKMKATKYVRKKRLGENAIALEYSHKYTYRLMPPIQPQIIYHTAISFLTPHYIVGTKVKAGKKICWIHTDYSNVSVNKKSEYKMWCRYDHIVAVSEATKRSFVSVFPQLSDRVTVIENILSNQLILKQAESKVVLAEDGCFKLLSIGRFSYSKNFDNVPDICRRIIGSGLKVTWYLIGYGPDEALIRKKIDQAEMQKYVIILGKKENPYPYIKECDLYVQPSRYEGKSVCVREAQILCKPVVITDYGTSGSQLQDGIDGMIVPMDNEGCAKGIASLLKNPNKMKEFEINCSKRDYSNTEEICKIYRMMEC